MDKQQDYDAQQNSWQIFAPEQEPGVHYVPVDTTQPISRMLEQLKQFDFCSSI